MTVQPEMSTTDNPSTRPTRAFMSYAHEDAQHKQNVLTVAEILRDGGVQVVLDRWHKVPRQDWNQWATREIENADFVLAFVSPSYKAVAEARHPAGTNLGAQHELSIIRELLNKDRPAWLPKVLPVILPDRTIEEVPLFLQPTTANHCRIDEVSRQGVRDLLELLGIRPGEASDAGHDRQLNHPSAEPDPPVREKAADATPPPAVPNRTRVTNTNNGPVTGETVVFGVYNQVHR